MTQDCVTVRPARSVLAVTLLKPTVGGGGLEVGRRTTSRRIVEPRSNLLQLGQGDWIRTLRQGFGGQASDLLRPSQAGATSRSPMLCE